MENNSWLAIQGVALAHLGGGSVCCILLTLISLLNENILSNSPNQNLICCSTLIPFVEFSGSITS